MDIIAHIKELMKERGWSTYELARRADLPQSTLSNLFNRHNLPGVPTLESICKAMGLTLSEFFSQESPTGNPEELEAELLTHWRTLSSTQKKVLLELLRYFPQ